MRSSAGATRTPRPILVTGSHRSGTTWIGRMLAASRDVGYLHEPFNVSHNRGAFAAPIPLWFWYVTTQNESVHLRAMQDTLRFRFNYLAALRHSSGGGSLLNAFRDVTDFHRARTAGARPLLKDPIAIFSVEWLVRRFAAQPIVLIRHPAAFAASLMRVNWHHPFDHFLLQPALMEHHLMPFASEIERMAGSSCSILEQSTLLWQIIYARVAAYQREHADWLFLRHEDISSAPEEQFAEVFQRLDLEYGEDVRAVVRRYSASSRPRESARGRRAVVLRNSTENVQTWRRDLSDVDVAYIRHRVEPLASLFYSSDEW